jgi:GrpB-like predicted nucleotidyltransferase (UPF0157 family)
LVVTVAEPDPRWAERGRTAVGVLGPLFDAVEHIGSTAVPGLAAKPVIDLMAAAADLDEVDDDALAALGYRNEPSPMSNRLFYWREDYDSLRYHLHVVTTESWPERKERAFRDYLLAHPDARDRYAALKRELMDRLGPGDAYTRGKTALIQELTDLARAERGLPPIPVWEE